jgi:hypothetical protein
MQGNGGKFKLGRDDIQVRLACGGRYFAAGHGEHAAVATLFIPDLITRHRRVSRQPAASASSTEQNQRVPLVIFISILAYQRLVGL